MRPEANPASGSDAPRPDAPPDGPPGRVRGKLVIAITVALCLVVPLFTVALATFTDEIRTAEDPPLVWAERKTWPALDVHYRSMQRGLMSAARTNEKYRDPGFHPAPGTRTAAETGNALAARLSAAADRAGTDALAALLPELRSHAETFPAQPHAAYLLAIGLDRLGRADEAESAYRRAFELAPAALVRRFTLPTVAPAAGYRVDDLWIGVDEVVDDTVRQAVVYRYPALVADADGEVFIPVPKAILRLHDPTAPPPGPDRVDATAWFTFPGNVGRLPTTSAPVPKPPRG